MLAVQLAELHILMKETSQKTRRLYCKDSIALEQILQKHATKPNWLRYSEDFSSEPDKRMLRQHAALIRELHGLVPNMVFTQLSCVEALEAIAIKRQWFCHESDRKEWANTLGRRIRCFCRHFQQSWLKARGSSSSWIRMIMGSSSFEEPAF